MTKTRLLVMVAPLAGLALLAWARRDPSPRATPVRVARAVQRPAPPSGAPYIAARPASRPALSPEERVAHGSEEVRVLSTYRNYRNALAGGRESTVRALRTVLLRERELALSVAERELARAPTPTDREIAQMTLDSLRR